MTLGNITEDIISLFEISRLQYSFLKMPNSIFDNIFDMSEGEIKVFLCLLKKAINANRIYTYINLNEIAKITKITKRRVIDILKRLTKKGMIYTVSYVNEKNRRKNMYILNVIEEAEKLYRAINSNVITCNELIIYEKKQHKEKIIELGKEKKKEKERKKELIKQLYLS